MENDVTYLAIVIGLFVLMFVLVKECDLIIGSDEAAFDEQGGEPDPVDAEGEDEAVAA